MKKRLLIIITLVLFLTGCSCTYNLCIKDNTFSEEVIIVGDNNSEINSLNNKWQIPTNKEEYNIGTDPSNKNIASKVYDYAFSNNRVTFKNDFTANEFIYSSAVSKCYNKLTVSNYEDTLIISTSQKVTCFDNNPPLNNVVINITVDRPVIKSNADSISGNTYTWNLSRSNSNKDINLILDNSNSDTKNNSELDKKEKKTGDYTMYIFAIILLFVFLVAYAIVNSIKNKDDSID